MFASKTPRDLNHDPEPMLDPFSGRRFSVADEALGYVHRPRPEFDHVQHNDFNPILFALRGVDVHREAFIRGFFASDPAMYNWPNWSAAHIDHARKVLSRLAALQEAL